ncbi:MAG: DUF2855 family protein, partial [Rectinemataceae bacterium]
MKRTRAMAVMVIVAAGTFAQTTKAPVTLSIIANQDWVTKPYMKAAWANYEKVTGNRLDIQALPIDNWETIMKTRAAAGELPDIVMTFAGPALDAMKPAETFYDLSNEAFVKDLKVCDQVVTYDALSSIDATKPTAFVDMAGSGAVLTALHHHIGDNMKESCIVGATHWESDRNRGDLPGAKPAFFFA